MAHVAIDSLRVFINPDLFERRAYGDSISESAFGSVVGFASVHHHGSFGMRARTLDIDKNRVAIG
jgi:hypothetical protein